MSNSSVIKIEISDAQLREIVQKDIALMLSMSIYDLAKVRKTKQGFVTSMDYKTDVENLTNRIKAFKTVLEFYKA